jgi:hypothetical protein
MLRLALPVVLAELGWMSMGIVDTLMVAPLGPAAIGAAGIGTSVHMAFAVFGMGLLLGLDTLVSQAHGAGDHRDCHRWLVHGVVMARPRADHSSGGARVLPARASIRCRPLLQSYFGIVIWSTVPLLLYAAVRRYLQGMHVVAPIAFALVTANLLNAAANWTLIHGRFGLPALGVSGAAWATVISRVYMLGVLVVAAWWIDRAGNTGLTTVSRTLSRERFARLWRLGFPAASQVTLEVGAPGPPPRSPPTSPDLRLQRLRTRSRSTSLGARSWCCSAWPRRSRRGNRVGAHARVARAPAGWRSCSARLRGRRGAVFPPRAPSSALSRPDPRWWTWAPRCCSWRPSSSSSTGCRRSRPARFAASAAPAWR